MARNYQNEYKKYQGTEKQKKNRASRNTARRRAISSGKVTKGSKKDVHHVNENPRDNSKKNLKVVPSSKNRSFPRTKTARKK